MKTSIKSLRKRNIRAAMHLRRKLRVRKKISGDAARPRLSVFRSARHIYVQAINDVEGVTIASASTVEKESTSQFSGKKKVEVALAVGELLGARLKEKGITSVVFDRNGYRYSGRVSAVAQGARSAGIDF